MTAAASETLGFVDLTWTAPTSDGGAAIDWYQVELSTDGGANWTVVDFPGGSPAFETCGDAGVTCRYRVSAHNWAGYGPAVESNDVTMPVAPDAPTDVSATLQPSGFVDLTWTAPAGDGGAAIDWYQVEISTDGGANWTILDFPTSSPAAMIG